MKVRLETMSKLHCTLFILVLLTAIVIIFGASFKAQYMLIYNTGDSYICASQQSSQEQQCQTFLHKDGYIWLGRLENLKLKNQILLVYGYVQ